MRHKRYTFIGISNRPILIYHLLLSYLGSVCHNISNVQDIRQ